MDAPPQHEQIQPFIEIARHLLALGLCPPEPLQTDTEHGFILLEDLGDNTFTRLLANGDDKQALYALAVDTLVQMQSCTQATRIELPAYSEQLLINEAMLLTEWYYPHLTGEPISDESRRAYIACWTRILRGLPRMDDTLVLRDFHVDNLIRLEDSQCGLLDFQDAVIGSPAYDLVSLLEDARRDMNAPLAKRMLERYFLQRPAICRADFMRWYHVLGAQRHCKVLGIFTRLSVRDNKHHYLDHIGRVERLLAAKLKLPELATLNLWYEQYILRSL